MFYNLTMVLVSVAHLGRDIVIQAQNGGALFHGKEHLT